MYTCTAMYKTPTRSSWICLQFSYEHSNYYTYHPVKHNRAHIWHALVHEHEHVHIYSLCHAKETCTSTAFVRKFRSVYPLKFKEKSEFFLGQNRWSKVVVGMQNRHRWKSRQKNLSLMSNFVHVPLTSSLLHGLPFDTAENWVQHKLKAHFSKCQKRRIYQCLKFRFAGF